MQYMCFDISHIECEFQCMFQNGTYFVIALNWMQTSLEFIVNLHWLTLDHSNCHWTQKKSNYIKGNKVSRSIPNIYIILGYAEVKFE